MEYFILIGPLQHSVLIHSILVFCHNDALHSSKLARTGIYNDFKRFLFHINTVLLNVVFIKESWGKN